MTMPLRRLRGKGHANNFLKTFISDGGVPTAIKLERGGGKALMALP